jgi:hypothetical protein
LPQFFTSPDSLLSNVREFFLVAYELADYKLNIVPRLQEKQTGFLIGLLKSLAGNGVRTTQYWVECAGCAAPRLSSLNKSFYIFGYVQGSQLLLRKAIANMLFNLHWVVWREICTALS